MPTFFKPRITYSWHLILASSLTTDDVVTHVILRFPDVDQLGEGLEAPKSPPDRVGDQAGRGLDHWRFLVLFLVLFRPNDLSQADLQAVCNKPSTQYIAASEFLAYAYLVLLVTDLQAVCNHAIDSIYYS